MIRVLIVEDSPVIREFLIHILSSDPELQIAGVARDGEEAVEAVKKYKPDVITMDIYMPRMDGFEATRRIMETQPTPIVIVSGSSRVKEVAFSFRAVEAGALAVVGRPSGIDDPDHKKTAQELVQKVKLMSEIKVIRRWPDLRKKIFTPPVPAAEVKPNGAEIRIVAIGASTGGPIALRTILSALSRNFPVPVLIVQHIVPGFTSGFAEWLADSSSFPVRVASDSENVLSGQAYVAPDGFQMQIERGDKIKLSKDYGDNGLRPSVGYLFRSVAATYGSNSVGVLLTGMGTDGARELKLLKNERAVTIAQDEESSIVFGMPGEAVKLNAATYVLPISKIAPALMILTQRRPPGGRY